MNENTTAIKRSCFAALRGICVFLISYAIAFFTNLRIRALYLEQSGSDFRDFPREGVATICIVASLLIFNSVARFFLLYYRPLRREFLAANDTAPSLLSPLRERDTYFELVGILVIPILFLGLHPFSEMEYLFGIAAWDSLAASALATVPTLSLFVLLYLWQGYECRRTFHLLRVQGELSRLDNLTVIVATALIILLGYPTAAPYAPYLLFTLYSVARILVSLTGALTLPLAVLLLALLILAPPLIRYACAQNRRRRFCLRIAALAAAHGYRFTDHTEENRRLGRRDTPTFTLEKDGHLYPCAFLFRQYPRLPLYFTANGEGYSLLRLGTRAHHLDIRLPFTYPTASEGMSLLLCDPPPSRMLVTDGKTVRRVDYPDRIWHTVLYSPATLIGAIERNHVGKFTSLSHE